MNDFQMVFVDDDEHLLNVSMIEAVEDLRSIRLSPPRRRITMQSGAQYESDGTRDELMEKLKAIALQAAGVDFSDVRFASPGRPIDD